MKLKINLNKQILYLIKYNNIIKFTLKINKVIIIYCFSFINKIN